MITPPSSFVPYGDQSGERPAPAVARQSDPRQRRDIDTPEGIGTGAKRVNDRRANDESVRDGEHGAVS
jgi:hypothetical protein